MRLTEKVADIMTHIESWEMNMNAKNHHPENLLKFILSHRKWFTCAFANTYEWSKAKHVEQIQWLNCCSCSYASWDSIYVVPSVTTRTWHIYFNSCTTKNELEQRKSDCYFYCYCLLWRSLRECTVNTFEVYSIKYSFTMHNALKSNTDTYYIETWNSVKTSTAQNSLTGSVIQF